MRLGKVFISGGTGFLGVALIQHILEQRMTPPGQIHVLARNEGNLVKLSEQFPGIQVHPGDLGDPYLCSKVFEMVRPRHVFHLAAFKHVGMAERETYQCIRSNVFGTLNLLEAVRHTKPACVVGISTDKAAQPRGVYGATKLLMERLFQEHAELYPRISYRLVRYGNVLYSTGSVLYKWRVHLSRGEPIIVTNLDSTRFYWTVDQAIDLIFESMVSGQGAVPYIAKLKGASLKSLLTAMIKKYGSEQSWEQIRTIGLQPGENLHEILDPALPNSYDSDQWTVEELLEVI